MSEGTPIRQVALLCALAASLATARAEPTRPDFPDNPRASVLRFEDRQGMGAVTATALGQDAQGFLWIGTQTGLYRFDGTRARKMLEADNLIGHYVVDLVIAPDGTPWFAGNRGIAFYKNGEFRRVPIPENSMALLSGVQIFAVDSRGTLYVLMFKKGLLILDPNFPSKGITIGQGMSDWETQAGILRTADDTIWFSLGKKLAHLKPGSHTIEVEPGIQLPKERVVALQQDGSGTIWVRTSTRLGRVDRRAHKLVMEPSVTGAANDEEGKPTVDAHGKLLVPSSSGLYWQTDGKWRQVTTRNGLASNLIQCAFEDREGTLWVGGSGTGLDRLPGVREWSAWTTSEGLPDNSTWATLRDNRGRLWVSTARGIAIWDARGHRWEKVRTLEEHLSAQIRPLQLAGDGSVWAQTITGAILRIDPNNFATTTYASYHGRNFVSMAAAPDGSIWAASRAHLVRFAPENGHVKQEEIPLPEIQEADVEFVAFSPNGVLWATGPGSLYRYDGRKWNVFTVKDGLKGQTMTSLAAPNDYEVWLSYNDVVGVSHVTMHLNGTTSFEFRDWDRTVVGHDSKGRMWFNGTDGIVLLWPDGRTQRITRANGLIWDDLSPWTGTREEADGSFLIATSRGLSRFKELDAKKTEETPAVVLTSVALGGLERKPNEKASVTSGNGSLTVQFSPLVLDTPDEVSCRYQLKGLEPYPTETSLREVQYGGLPAGNYEFWVQCKQPDINAYSAKTSFHFQVMPNVWQTYWARGLIVAGLLAGVWVFVSLRTRALHRRKSELERAVAERNAELMRKNKELQEISLTDPLTGVRNRRYFYETISKDIAQALRSHQKSNDSPVPVARQDLIFALVDIDRFKRVNDEMGHTAGDKLLQEVAKRIESVMRKSDDLVRWGGEEFLLVCRTTDRENASLLCARVLEAVRETPFDVGNGVQVHKTCSIGWAPFPWVKGETGMLSIENVLELADKALYLAKREGRNRSYGFLPAPTVVISEKSVSIENLRDCPPELVQIV
ncbi:MAG TPA: diguanylate cyclase [Terriglobales bacterium]|nr:diguanylate cyclase [Terriglobales bacterium]